MTGVLTLSGSPTNPNDAATKSYVDSHSFTDAAADGTAYGRLNNAWARVLPLAGGTMTGNLDMGTHSVTNVVDPVNPQDAVTLNYFTGHTLPDAPSDGNVYGRKNGTWAIAGGGAGGIYIQDTYPTAPLPNSLWWRSTDGQMFVYYNDGNSSQWVTANSTNLTMYGNVYIQDTPPAGAADNQLWWNSTTGRLYIMYNDGTSRQWVDANPQPAVAAVQYDSAQNLSAAQQVQARQNIYAAPFDSMMYNNIIINGGMDISQANGTTTIPVPSGGYNYVVDQFAGMLNSPSGIFTGQQAPTTGLVGLSNCVVLTSTTPMGGPAAGEYVGIISPIEGYRWAKLGFGSALAVPVTISFWVFANATGTGTLSLRNNAQTRCYCVNFSVSAAATWQYVSVTIPGDTAGTWLTTTGVGVYLTWSFGVGTTYRTAPGAWVAGNFLGTPSTTNFFTATNNQVAITGVSAFAGTEGPSAARSQLAVRSYDEEMRLCQRYFEIGIERLRYMTVLTGITYAYDTIEFKTVKRVAPSSIALANWSYYSGSTPTPFTPVLNGVYTTHFEFLGQALTSWNGWTNAGTWAANARF
jgi:hypothetical protein